MSQNLKYFLGWSLTGKIGPRRFKQLEKYFSKDWPASWQASANDLFKAGFSQKLATEIFQIKNTINLELELEKINHSEIHLLSLEDQDYPPLLRQIFDPPFLLYTRGSVQNWTYPLAVVGSRKSSPYGQRVIADLVEPLAQAGLAIISGLAFGIDSLAHEAALKTGGLTIAVLGNGLNQIYPTSHQQLAQDIVSSGGTLISEYPPNAVPMKYCFPQRNRIIAGLSLGVLIVEGSLLSGSLITAQRALESNREIFAVPGDIYRDTSSGTNSLIQRGAKLVTRPSDILETFNLQSALENTVKTNWQPSNPTEKIIIKHLNSEPLHIDKLAELSKLDISALNSALSLLEITGHIRHLGGQNYILNS